MMEVADANESGFARPLPREPKSPAKIALIKVQNRRREYLQRTPAYFDSLEHELSGMYIESHALFQRRRSDGPKTHPLIPPEP